MPPSQLKQLKASLKESGVYGPQKSKKQRREGSKDATDRIKRNTALQQIRDRFNPFEVKTTKKDKFEVVSTRKSKDALGRPGVTKGFGEDRRKATLLREIQRRNKIGGVVDRRFGEHDPSMTPEQRAAERYARQNLKKSQRNNIFNLEDEEGGGVELTHAGRALSFGDEDAPDDFDEILDAPSDASSNEDEADIDDRPRKRPRLGDGEPNDEEEGPESDLRKTRKEVMEEVMAKSKLHRYERQKAKEDDDDLRATLDKGMSGVYAALRGQTDPKQKSSESQVQAVPNSEPIMNPERAAMLAGKDPATVEKEYIEKEYERRVHEMFEDRRARPSERTRTEEEKAAREAERLHELEAKRVRRMMGDIESSDEAEEEPTNDVNDEEEEYRDDAEAFGLSQKVTNGTQPPVDVEDEDEFVLDEDLIASDSDADATNEEQDSDHDENSIADDGDDEFINGLRMPDPKDSGREANGRTASKSATTPYAYACPESHAEFLQIVNGEDVNQIPIIIQRIRALYHPSLSPDNKEKLARFADVLVAHVVYLGQAKQTAFSVVENVIRHLHSMAKSMPEAVGLSFRSALRKVSEERDLTLNAGDVVLFTAIGTIFPTSDHFHAVVTPAMLIIARYLGQTATTSVVELVIGMYCCTLALQYQQRSNRYVPEVVRYLCKILTLLVLPTISGKIGHVPQWLISLGDTSKPILIQNTTKPQLAFSDIHVPGKNIGYRILHTTLTLLSKSAMLWKDKTAINEILCHSTVLLSDILSHPQAPLLLPKTLHITFHNTQTHLLSVQHASLSSRLPLTLHHHRPLAIKTSVPKFEESYNPTRHYDPDADRAGLARLKAEHRRERKGAIRELRRDANFVAREQLRDKKEKDDAYEKKFKRLVSEIQGEEGREGKGYEREKAGRKMVRKKGRM